jgi:RHH-type transcriptional regulator, proline utilization regulon repressor / proline dehydrogenase / delta 1-pyrroline-5-carboxylate dehydrogenase
VGSQPFGGEGLSGTGPKAGGPAYVARFRAPPGTRAGAAAPPGPEAWPASAQMPGPTGEMNRLTTHPRGPVLCLGPGGAAAAAQAAIARAAGCPAIEAPGGDLPAPGALSGIALAACDGTAEDARAIRRALSERPGPIVPLVRPAELGALCRIERHLCIDTTASGGNATLLAASA